MIPYEIIKLAIKKAFTFMKSPSYLSRSTAGFGTKSPLSENSKFSINTTNRTKLSDYIEALDVATVAVLVDW
jgi:hypothetical protein